jgi:hypothetical protein
MIGAGSAAGERLTFHLTAVLIEAILCAICIRTDTAESNTLHSLPAARLRFAPPPIPDRENTQCEVAFHLLYMTWKVFNFLSVISEMTENR